MQIGTKISNAFKELNYRGEVGYDRIIYPNEKDTRYLLRFVVTKLPKDGRKKGGDDEDDAIYDAPLNVDGVVVTMTRNGVVAAISTL